MSLPGKRDGSEVLNVVSTIASTVEASYAAERSGDIAHALQQAQAAVTQARASDHSESLAGALACLAYMHDRLGHHEQARAVAEEALAHAAPLSPARARALKTLGDCAHESGDLAAAETCYHQAIDLARQLGLAYVLHRCLHSLAACVYLPRGQFELALAADGESAELAEKAGFLEEIWLPLLTLSWTLWITGNRGRALEAADKMRQHAPPDSLAEGYYACLRGDMAQDGNDPQTALAWYARARMIADLLGEPGLSVELRLGLSRYHRTFGDGPTAYQWADDAFAFARRSESFDLQGIALLERGQAAWKSGDLAAARQDLEAAIVHLAPLPANYHLAYAYLLLAGLLFQQRMEGAEAAWIEAMTRIVNGGYGFLFERERGLALPLLNAYLDSGHPETTAAAKKVLRYLEHVPPPPLIIATLGQFAVRQGRTLLPDSVWQRRAGELFRLLLISPGRTLLRDQVMDALWSESSPRTATDLFYRATSALRHALEADLPDKFPSRYLKVGQGEISLQLPPESWIDYQAFQAHIRAGAWQAALDLYRGDLFPGDLYADWAVGLRETLKQQALQAAMALAQECAAAGDDAGALAASRRALSLEPWQEEAAFLAMQACVRINDRIGAIRLYRQLARSLQEELGIEPQAKLRRLYESLQ